jgi:hypothetical protein
MANKDLKLMSPTETEAKTKTTETAAASTPDPFDPERWRRKAEGNAPKVSKLLSTVPVWMKPSDDKFVRVHPDPNFRLEASIVSIKGEGDYLVLPGLEENIPAQRLLLPVTLFTAITYAGDVFIWIAKYPASSNLAFARWPESMREAIELAMTRWVRVESNTSIGAYVATIAEGEKLAEPKWPDATFGKILGTAFAGRLIDQPDHALVKRLRGLL